MTSIPAFGLYNPSWHGVSELHAEVDTVGASPFVATDVTEYDDVSPNETVAVVLSPDEPYTDSEAVQLREFVAAGGTLVLAENYGPHSNALLQRLDELRRRTSEHVPAGGELLIQVGCAPRRESDRSFSSMFRVVRLAYSNSSRNLTTSRVG